MDNELSKNLIAHFDTLPKEVQELVLSIDIISVLNESEDTKIFSQKQKVEIANQITMVLLGLEDIKLLTTKITHSANISRDRAEKVFKLISEQVFKPNYNTIKLLYDDPQSDYPEKTPAMKSTSGIVHNDIPSPDKYKEPADLEGTGAPKQTPVPQAPNAPKVPQAPKKLENVEAEYKKEAQPDALDIFKKRLSSPVRTQAKEENISEGGEEKERIANINPSTKKDIEKDPYKESID